MYHHSGSVARPTAGSAVGVLEATGAAPDSDAMLFQRCTWCGTAMYHRLLCPVCRCSELRTERSEGTGTVRHSTVVHRNIRTLLAVSEELERRWSVPDRIADCITAFAGSMGSCAGRRRGAAASRRIQP